MDEEWRSISGTNGGYQVSNLGKVRSLPRVTTRINARYGPILYSIAGKTLSLIKMKNGYHGVSVYFDGEVTRMYVHHLVMNAFGPPKPFVGAVIRHLDDNKLDSSIANLAWGTRNDNANDSRRNGTMHLGDERPNAKLDYQKAATIKARADGGVSILALAREHDVNLKTIWQIKVGRTWTRQWNKKPGQQAAAVDQAIERIEE